MAVVLHDRSEHALGGLFADSAVPGSAVAAATAAPAAIAAATQLCNWPAPVPQLLPPCGQRLRVPKQSQHHQLRAWQPEYLESLRG